MSASTTPAPDRPATPAGDDAEVIRRVAEVQRLDAEADKLHQAADELPDFDPGHSAIWDKIHALSRQQKEHLVALAQLRAVNREALAAKAWVVRRFSNVDVGEHFDPSNDDALAWSLAGDLLGLPAEKAPDTGEVEP